MEKDDHQIIAHFDLTVPLTWLQIAKQKDALARAVSLQEQYEKMLDDFSHLLDIADTKLHANVVVSDLSQVKDESNRHKVVQLF